MAGVLTRKGRLWQAESLRQTNSVDYELVVKLATAIEPTDPLAPSVGEVVEATFGGYADVNFASDSILAATLDGDVAVAKLPGNPSVWDCASAPETIVGWYLVAFDTGDILAYEVYDEPDVLEVGSRHTLFAEIRVGQCA